jgi:hypothetical protein
MSAKPSLPHSSSLSTMIVAAIAAFVAVGLLSAVVLLFQRAGAPYEQLVAAERACAQYAYVSERQACVNQWIAAARASKVAGK